MNARKSASWGFWREFWRLIGSLVGAFNDAKREYRAGKRGGSRSTGRPPSSRQGGRRTGGRSGSRGGGGFTPVDGRSVEDIRRARKTAAEGWDATYTRPKWAGGTEDPFDPDQWGTARRGSRVPWSTSHTTEDDPDMVEMQGKHGIDRWGRPIQGHDRWATPEGQAELEAALAAEHDGLWNGGAEPGSDGGDPSSAAGGAV